MVQSLLRMVALTTAIPAIGPVSGPAAIELAVTNPEYGDYKQRLLIRVDPGGIQWASLKRFGNNPITLDDVKAVLGS